MGLGLGLGGGLDTDRDHGLVHLAALALGAAAQDGVDGFVVQPVGAAVVGYGGAAALEPRAKGLYFLAGLGGLHSRVHFLYQGVK